MNNYGGALNILELKNITQTYRDKNGKPYDLFSGLNLAIEDVPDKGQFIALMGESGCGKSTLLRYLTGLQKPTLGEVLIEGRHLTNKDTIPMVFQSPSSLEWFSVLDNVALPLTLKGYSRKDAVEQAMAMIKIVGLDGHEKKYAKGPALSGGQLQRVAIARSLVANPKMIMLDEPYSALDITARRKMQDFMVKIFQDEEVKGLNPTVVLVTHAADEAVQVANDIFIMGGTPSSIQFHIKSTRPVRNSKEAIEIISYIESKI